LSPGNWRESVKKSTTRWLASAWPAMMMQKIMAQNKIARETARRLANGTIGKDLGNSTVDDVGDIKIGDEVQYHYHQPDRPASTTPSWLKTGAMLAVAALGGSAAVPIASIAWEWLSRPRAEAPVEPQAGQPAQTPPITHPDYILVPGSLEIDKLPGGVPQDADE
jgi:hypothetical protein